MTTLIVKLVFNLFLGLNTPHTTDDVWDCYKVYHPTKERYRLICKREITPCHYKHSPRECEVVVEVPYAP